MKWLAIVPLAFSALFVLLKWLGARIGGPSQTQPPKPAETAIVVEGAKAVEEAKAQTKTNIEEIRHDSNAGITARLLALARLRK